MYYDSVIMPPVSNSCSDESVIYSEVCREGFAVFVAVKPSRFFCALFQDGRGKP